MLQKIDPKTLTKNPFTLIGDQWMLITAGTPRPLQHHDCQLGRRGCHLGCAGSHLLYPPPALHQGVCGSERVFSLCFFDESYREKLTY